MLVADAAWRVVYDTLVALHVVVALAGLGTLAATAGYATAAFTHLGPEGAAAVASFFAGRANRVARALHAVPVFGIVLLALGRRGYALEQAWG